MKLLECLKCGRQTPGLDITYSRLNVYQQHEKRALNDGRIVEALNKSEVLIMQSMI